MAFFTLVNQVLVLFILMAAGYFLTKFGMLTDTGISELNKLLCYLISPCVILYSFQTPFSMSLLKSLLVSLASAFGIHIFSIIVGQVIFNKKTLPNDNERSVMRFSTAYSNCGTMGIPLLQTMAGTHGMLLGASYIAVFNLLSWTHGMALYTGKTSKKALLKVCCNPNILAIAVGVLCFCLRIRFPAPLYQSLNYVSDMNLGMGMIIIGTQVTKVKLRSIFTGKLVWIGMFLRNLAIPVVLLFALHFIGIHGSLLLCCILPVACPAASNTVLYAELVGRDTRFPTKLMTFSTLFCIVTIPAVIYLGALLKF